MDLGVGEGLNEPSPVSAVLTITVIQTKKNQGINDIYTIESEFLF